VTPEAIVDKIRAALVEGHDALEQLMAAMAQALTKELKPADRRALSAARDSIARILARWRQDFADDPELLARVESLAQKDPRDAPGTAAAPG
jgi:hypothetical protein